MSEYSLDAVDKGILYLLQENARRNITEIADAVNVSDNTVRNRMERMEAEGIIEGYGVHIDYGETRTQHHYQFVCSAAVNDREEIVDDVLDVTGVVEVRTLMTGRQNVLVTAVTETIDEITEIARAIDSIEAVKIEFEDLIRADEKQPLGSYDIENAT